MSVIAPAQADPRTVYLADYRPFSHSVESVFMTFKLAPMATRVITRLQMRRNPAALGAEDLRLDGEELKLISLRLDGAEIAYDLDETGLSIAADLLPEAFTLQIEVEIAPQANTALEGLYMSRGMYCTQCEAQGFRKITYYPDRPDVMARFKVRIEADLPVLLSNGNAAGAGASWAEWDDPWPKPAYLFALVAGDLQAYRDHFTTASGRAVDLAIWVRAGDEERCAYAMDSLKRSMRWDEEVYGREYDLDVFNIVAVDDFNMGAMENKGLNIFNSKLVLASPATATDDDYARIEAVIAHEYFHNWTGNRITCRDWFQLCLKEGLTVYRDQHFSGDMRSAAVKRIEDVLTLRARQFREDQGPLAHPVRPESFVEINNFYTATVYEKGAELIGMLRALVGDEGYRKALDLYFDRHDGDAATIEDWLCVFEEATGRDLSQFKLWYSQAGTPRLSVTEDWTDGSYALTFTQENPPTPGQAEKKPLVLPIALGLLGPSGEELLPTTILEMTQQKQTFTFDGLSARPIPSILRGFSAPVVLTQNLSSAGRAFLLAHDSDPFNRWEAGRALAREMLVEMISKGAGVCDDWLSALGALARDESLDPAFKALCLRLPSEDELAASLHSMAIPPDPEAIRLARRQASLALAQSLGDVLDQMIGDDEAGGFSPSAQAAGKRALHGLALGLKTRLDGGERAKRAFASASNMTDTIAALAALLDIGGGQEQLAAFGARWKDDRNVMDKWYIQQILHSASDQTAALAQSLTEAEDFDWKNPNRMRAVLGALAGNHAGFHHASGAGYRFLAQALLKLDRINPQTAARLSTGFETWPRYDGARQALVKEQLDVILATEGLSRDLAEMAGRMRAAG